MKRAFDSMRRAMKELEAASAKLSVYQKAAVLMLTPRDQTGNKKVVAPWRSY